MNRRKFLHGLAGASVAAAAAPVVANEVSGYIRGLQVVKNEIPITATEVAERQERYYWDMEAKRAFMRAHPPYHYEVDRLYASGPGNYTELFDVADS